MNYSGAVPDLFSVVYAINNIVFFNTSKDGKIYLNHIKNERKVDTNVGHKLLGDAGLSFLELSRQVIEFTAYPSDVRAYVQDLLSSLPFLLN